LDIYSPDHKTTWKSKLLCFTYFFYFTLDISFFLMDLVIFFIGLF
jgi:hypothetical protein